VFKKILSLSDVRVMKLVWVKGKARSSFGLLGMWFVYFTVEPKPTNYVPPVYQKDASYSKLVAHQFEKSSQEMVRSNSMP
jgi:hypothetical protein